MSAEFDRLEPKLGNVREKIESAFGIDARNAVDAVELGVSERSAAGKFCKPGSDVILRAVEGYDGTLLSKRRRVAGAVALDGVDCLGNRFRRGGKSNAPTSHRIRLGQPVDYDGVIQMRLRKAGNADVLGSVIDQLFVNLVAHDQYPAFDTDVAQGFEFLAGIKRAGRVARRIKNEQSGALGDGCPQLIRCDFEIGLVCGLYDDRSCLGQAHHLGIA